MPPSYDAGMGTTRASLAALLTVAFTTATAPALAQPAPELREGVTRPVPMPLVQPLGPPPVPLLRVRPELPGPVPMPLANELQGLDLSQHVGDQERQLQ